MGPTQPPLQQVPGAPFLGIKQPGHEDDHSHPSSTKIKNAWSYASIPHTPSWHGTYLCTKTTSPSYLSLPTALLTISFYTIQVKL
jgi:hypothetical protein